MLIAVKESDPIQVEKAKEVLLEKVPTATIHVVERRWSDSYRVFYRKPPSPKLEFATVCFEDGKIILKLIEQN